MLFAKICNLTKIQHFTARSFTVLKINKKPSLSRLYRECNTYLSPAFVKLVYLVQIPEVYCIYTDASAPTVTGAVFVTEVQIILWDSEYNT